MRLYCSIRFVSFSFVGLCGTMGGIRFCGCVCFVGVPVRLFFCPFWRETHIKGLRARSPIETGRKDVKRQGPRAVYRSQGKATVRERRLLSEELGPVDPEVVLSKRERMGQRSWWPT